MFLFNKISKCNNLFGGKIQFLVSDVNVKYQIKKLTKMIQISRIINVLASYVFNNLLNNVDTTTFTKIPNIKISLPHCHAWRKLKQ